MYEDWNGIVVVGVLLYVDQNGFFFFINIIFKGDDWNIDCIVVGRNEQIGRDKSIVYVIFS